MATTPPTNDHLGDEDVDNTPLFPVDSLGDATKQQIINHVTGAHGMNPNVMQPFPQGVVNLFTTRFSPPRPGRPTSSLGKFGNLAVELQCMIMLQMDITSLVRFSQTCRLARAAVRSLPEFRTVTTYAGTTLFMAVLATRLSDLFSIARLHDALTTWQCTECGYSFGDYVFLPFLERYCVHCLETPDVKEKCSLRTMAWQKEHAPSTRTPPCIIHGWQDGRPVGLGLVVFPTECQDDYIQRERGRRANRRRNKRKRPFWTVLNLGPPPPLPIEYPRTPEDCAAVELYNPWRPEEDHYYAEQASSLDWAFNPIPPKHTGLTLSIAVPYLVNSRMKEVISHGVRCRGPGCEEEGTWLPSEYVEEHFPWCQGAVSLWLDAQERQEKLYLNIDLRMTPEESCLMLE